MENLIAFNNNMINMMMNNPSPFQNHNNLINKNNQIPKVIPRKEIKEERTWDYFPGNKNKRINIIFELPNGAKSNIPTPVNIKIKDLLLAFCKKLNIDKNFLNYKIYFLFNGERIDINEQKNLEEYGLNVDRVYTIIVYEINNFK